MNKIKKSGIRLGEVFRRPCGYRKAAFLLYWVFFCVAPPLAASDSEVVVIVNPDVTLRRDNGSAHRENQLSKKSLLAIYAMRLRTWPDDRPTRVFVLEDSSPIHSEFAKSLLSIFPYQLRRRWDRLVYTGTGQAPYQVGSQEEMREKVASTPGAIGYLKRNKADGSVRIVEVQ